MERRYPLPSRLVGLEERRKLPSEVRVEPQPKMVLMLSISVIYRTPLVADFTFSKRHRIGNQIYFVSLKLLLKVDGAGALVRHSWLRLRNRCTYYCTTEFRVIDCAIHYIHTFCNTYIQCKSKKHSTLHSFKHMERFQKSFHC